MDPFRVEIQNLTWDLFERGQISEDQARSRFSNIGCDFDTYKRDQEKETSNGTEANEKAI